MTDYAEYLTQIDRLRREIHDACKAGEWGKAQGAASQLHQCTYDLHLYLVRKSLTGITTYMTGG